MKKCSIVTTAAFLLSVSGPAAAMPDDISTLNSLSLLRKKEPPAVLYTMLPADSSVLPRAAEPLQEEPPSASSAAPEKVPALAAYGRAFLPDIGDGTKRIFSRDNASLALVGFGITGLSFAADHRVQNYFQEKKPMENTANIGGNIGKGYYHIGVGMVLLGAGELWDDKKMADTGIVALEALLVNGIVTESLKYAISRDRPNGENDMSFPSGHASSTATLAASVSEMYDWDLRIAVPLYMVTAFVGASRIQANEHHLSDVLAGTTIGTIVGVSFAKSRKEKNAPGGIQDFAITPLADDGHRGIVLTWRF